MSKPEKHIFTADEYLAYEETAETRSEFFNGDWSFSVYEDDDQELTIASIRAAIPVEAVYRRVEF